MSTKGTKVLLVEDEDAHATFVIRVFEENSSTWKIDHVSTIADALKWLDENKNTHFLVISDYRLPDGTGLDLTKGANSPEKVGYPLIILTGVGSEKLAVSAFKSGAMDYVVKNPEDSAWHALQFGCRMLAVSDSKGGIVCGEGLDPRSSSEIQGKEWLSRRLPWKTISNEELLELDVDY